MNNSIRLISMLLVLITWTSNVAAEIQISNALVKDISQTYGYYLGQSYSLVQISKKYPALGRPAMTADKEFSSNFGSSIASMDSIMTKFAMGEWQKIKDQLNNQVTSQINFDQVTEVQASQFVDAVRGRARGKVESPVIETLLLFKPPYEKKPEREFLDGYKEKYTTNGAGKAKGVAFSIETPKTWIAKEGDRPNIVQKFVSENGRGLELLLILIKEIPLQPGERITEEDVLGILNPKDIKDFLPDGATYINSGKLTLENLPGFWAHYQVNMSRVKSKVAMEIIMYTIFYNNKLIQIQGQVTNSINGKPTNRGGLNKYEKLFDLMTNSFVIANMYK